MKELITLLTRKAKGFSHQPTLLTIDWTNINQEQLQCLARSCIIHSLQRLWQRDLFKGIPEEYSCNASEFVHGQLHEVLIDRPPVPKQKPSYETELDKMLAALSPEERMKLFSEL